MTELFQTTYKSRPPVVEGLLYAGAYILAGAPKIGKSFLVAQIAHHVSTGQDLWGYKVHQGTVLYLALEDDESREWEGSPTELVQAIQTDMAVNRLAKHLNVNASHLLE